MAIEIERKFLLVNDDWKKYADKGVAIRQGYLAESTTASVRVRIQDDSANINIKSAGINISRSEYEYAIPLEDARSMLRSLCNGPLIEKTRYHVTYDDKIWEIDVFEGDNKGLIVAEIELAAIDEDFARPPWVGDDVSDDARYYNMNLVKHPYKDWK